MFSIAAHHQSSRSLGVCAQPAEVKETHGWR